MVGYGNGWLKVKRWFLLLLTGASLYGAPPFEAVPWTKNFLEIRPTLVLERLSATPRHRRLPAHSPEQAFQGTLLVSGSPYPEWESDIFLSGNSIETAKIGARVERQLLSDLTGSPVALTCFAAGSTAQRERARKAVFFEMAPSTAECGVGLGKHLIVRPHAYTQLFAYVGGGIGTHNARWMGGEVGMQQVLFSRHFLRGSLGCTETFGRARRFCGIGTMRTVVKTVTASYAYRFSNGVEARISAIWRMVTKGPVVRAQSCQASISVPLSF